MELMDVVRARRSVRAFGKKPVSDKLIAEILEAGRLAPSLGNVQNWRFGVVRDQRVKKELALAAREQLWLATAPVVIAYCCSLEHDIRDLPPEDIHALFNRTRFGAQVFEELRTCPDRRTTNILLHHGSLLLAGSQVFLAAVDRGLSACWVGCLDIARASRALGLPDSVSCLYLMPVGYAGEKPQPIERKAMEEIVFKDRWVGES